MLKVLITIGLLGGYAQAKGSKGPKVPAKYYLNGQELGVQDALMASIEGKGVLKCQVMEPKVSKSGTSISMKVRRP